MESKTVRPVRETTPIMVIHCIRFWVIGLPTHSKSIQCRNINKTINVLFSTSSYEYSLGYLKRRMSWNSFVLVN